MFKALPSLLLVSGFAALSASGHAAEPTPVAVTGGKATVSPDNTYIKFVGTHRGAKPDPRTGTFKKFSGEAEVDASTKALKSLTLDIDVSSVSTEFSALTNHLKGPDFFDVREHKSAKFVSTKVTPGANAGEYTVAGELTLHGAKKTISAPVKTSFTDKGLTLTADFAIDRTEFGMKFGQDKIENTVALTFVIGEKNKTLVEAEMKK